MLGGSQVGRGRQVTDDELLQAARELFLQHGPSASVDLVAERVGITGPAVFRRMGSKQNLMVRALTSGFGGSFVGVLQSGPHTDVPLREQLTDIVRVLRQDIEELLPCLSTLRAAGMEPTEIAGYFEEPPPARAQREMAAWIRRGQRSGLLREQDADAAAISCIGAVHMRVFFGRVLGLRIPGADERVEDIGEFLEGALGAVDVPEEMDSVPDLSGDPGWTPARLPTDVGIESFVSGNPAGQRLQVRHYLDGDQVLRARVWFGPGSQGPPGHAHGGSMAAVLDKVFAGAVWLSGYPAVALELTSRFRKMLPLGTVATVTARVQSIEGRKVRVSGRIEGSDGTVFAEGEALFLALDPARHGDLTARARDMLGTPGLTFFGQEES